jgi:hypothetical protein
LLVSSDQGEKSLANLSIFTADVDEAERLVLSDPQGNLTIGNFQVLDMQSRLRGRVKQHLQDVVEYLLAGQPSTLWAGHVIHFFKFLGSSAGSR